MINILVTGAKGQLGSEIKYLSPDYPKCHFIFTDKEELDISNFQALQEFFELKKVDIIINAAAYTAVDKAEEEEELAMKINNKAIFNLSLFAKRFNIKLIHVSTDYVFDGKKNTPYSESDRVNPIGAYGKTKLAGEFSLIDSNPNNSMIIRTSWLYSLFGQNFLNSMIRLSHERESLGIVYDQIGSPTYARDLAKFILDFAPSFKSSGVKIYHYSNEGVASWYDFAHAIFEIANIKMDLKPILSHEYPTPTKRPSYSVLDKALIKKDFDITIPHWRTSLQKCLMEL